MPTTAINVSRELIETAIENAGLDPVDCIRDGYSGRGMRGDTCFGIVVDSVRQLSTFFLRLGEQARMFDEEAERESLDASSVVDDMENMLDRSAEDNMGRSVIVYFPGFTLED